MSERERIALIDRLRALPAETEWIELKRNRCEPQVLGQYLSALANSACLANQPRGYLVFGIDDATHAVVGTRFDPYSTKGKGNQDLLPWLAAGLRPNTGFEAHVVEHPDGRVVLFESGPAHGEPVSFHGTPYVRVGSSKTELRNHPEKARALWTRGSDCSAEVCAAASLADLDPDAVAKAREQFVVKHPGQRAPASRKDREPRPPGEARVGAHRAGFGRRRAMTKLGRRAHRHCSRGELLPQSAHMTGFMPLLEPVEFGTLSKGSSQGMSKGRPSGRSDRSYLLAICMDLARRRAGRPRWTREKVA